MWAYNHSVSIGDSEETTSIQHYGVLGMKWGVRRNPSKAYSKAIKKKEKIDAKVAQVNYKSAKYKMKASKKRAKSKSPLRNSKADQMDYKASKLSYESAKLQKKGLKWVKAMDKTFRDYDVKKLSSSEMAKKGQKYMYEVTKRK